MTKERLQKLAGIITESTINEFKILPPNVMNQSYMYIGKTLEFHDPSTPVFDTLKDFYAEVMSGWDKGHAEAKKYLESLSVEGDKIVSTYSGKKTVELKEM
jgi:hypothetical protein